MTHLPFAATARLGAFAILLVAPLALRAADAPAVAVITFDASGERTQLVAEPAAAAKKALAIDVGSGTSGSHKLKIAATSVAKLAPGRYRVTLFARLHGAPTDDFTRMRFDLSLAGGGASTVKKPFVWTMLDSTPDRYTPITFETTLLAEAAPIVQFDWQQVAVGSSDKVQPLRKEALPSSPDAVAVSSPKKKNSLLGNDDLLGEIKAESAPLPALTSIQYPALLLDRVTFEPLSRGAPLIERVHPQFVHVYPNQANPIAVDVRQLGSLPSDAAVRLDLYAGLDELVHSETKSFDATAATTTVRFDWPGGPREFGYEARATLLVGGKPVDVRSEYFSVSFPIWKTALQGPGFLDFHDRIAQMPDHVAENRRKYINVEEAFSWQPSSWTDLNPKSEHWWTGQGDAHNSAEGVKTWLGLSHAEGIKMITYLWPTASGPEAIEWGRQTPELITHGRVGLPTEFFDVEDLRLKSITEADERLWNLRSGIWNYLGINNGLLRSMNKGMEETIASAKRFGWDGARFDKPPGWGAMNAADVHEEFKLLGVEPLMQKLVPEYYEQREGQWSGEAVSLANVRYARHKLQEADPHFALSYNFGVVQDATQQNKFYDECCANGGQIMDEQIRQVLRGPWKDYLHRIRTQADLARERGGHHCCVVASGFGAATRLYAICSLFIGGSHPYGDYGWNAPLPGHYAQFITRFGEYCWASDLTPTTAEAESFTIDDDKSLWWRDLPRRRTLPDGRTQWVVHLLSNPPSTDMAPTKPGTMTPWRQKLAVGRKSTAAPTVWALSAEPTTRSEKLEPKQIGDRYVVEIPEHRVWTMLVWTEAAQ